MGLNGDYAVFQDAQRHTCIRVAVGKKGVDYIPYSASEIAVVHATHLEFEKQYRIELTDYPVSKAALSYLNQSWTPVTPAAKKYLSHLTGGKFVDKTPELNFENKESIMTEEAKAAAKKVSAPKKVEAPKKVAAPAAKKPTGAHTKEENQARNNSKLAGEKAAAKVAAKVEKVAAPKKEKAVKAPADYTVTLKKSDKDETLPPQARVFLDTLKVNGNKLPIADLLAKAAKSLVSKQTPQAVFTFYRKKMLDGGFIAVA